MIICHKYYRRILLLSLGAVLLLSGLSFGRTVGFPDSEKNSLELSKTLKASLLLQGDSLLCGSNDSTLLIVTGSTGARVNWYNNQTILPNKVDTFLWVKNAGSLSVVLTYPGSKYDTLGPIAIRKLTRPAASISPVGPAIIFDTDSVSLVASPTGSFTYSWLRFGIPILGANSNTYEAKLPGSYNCVVSNGKCSDTSNSFQLSTFSTKSLKISVLGQTIFCDGDSTSLSLPFSSLLSYQWLVNGNNIPGANSNRYTAKQNGRYTCRISLSGGSQSYSDTVLIQVLNRPISQLRQNGSASICDGDSLELSSINSSSAFSYRWLLNNSLIDTSGKNSIFVKRSGAYRLITSNSSCSDTSAAFVLTVVPNPNANIVASGTLSRCENEGKLSLFASPLGGTFTYAWYQNGLLLNARTSDSLQVIKSGSYQCVVSASGCADSSNIINVNIFPSPTAVLNPRGNTTFCAGDSLLLQAQTQTGSSIRWQRNGTDDPDLSGSSVYVNASGSIRFIANLNGCLDTSNAVTVNVVTAPNASFSANGPLTFFNGDSVIFQAQSCVGCSFQWYRDNLPISNATGPRLAAKITGIYQLIANRGSCADTSISIAVTVLPPSNTNIVAGGPTSFCTGDSVILLATSDPTFSYQWLKNGLAISGATGSNLVVKSSGNYQCRITVSGIPQTSNSIIVIVKAIPPAVINAGGSLSFCQDDSVTLFANQGIGLKYQWFRSGLILNNDTFAQYVAKVSGNFECQISLDGCMNISNNLTVTANQAPNANILAASATTFFAGDSVRLFATNAGSGISYQWYRNGNIILGERNLSFNAKTSGLYTCILSRNGCGDTSNQIGVQVLNSNVTIAASGNTNFCTGDSVTLRATKDSLYSYAWFRNGVLQSGSNNDSIVVSSSGIYFCEISAFGSSRRTNSINVQVNSPPIANIIAGGQTTIFQGNTVSLIASGGGSYQYRWIRNGMALAGDTTMSLQANQTGLYRCLILNAGCGDSSNTIPVTVIPVSEAYISTSSDTTVCTGDTVVLYANTNPNFSYQWRRNGSVILGAVDTIYLALTSGTYSCEFSVGNNTVIGNSIQVRVNSYPQKNITLSGDLDFCPGDSLLFTAPFGVNYTYQWFRNGLSLPAMSRLLMVKDSAEYHCRLSNFNCVDSSDRFRTNLKTQPLVALIDDTVRLCEKESHLFKTDSVNNHWSYEWTDSAGLLLGSMNSLNYQASQNERLRLITLDTQSNCTLSDTAWVRLKSNVSLSINLSDTALQNGEELTISDNSSGADSIFIDFGDGTNRVILPGSQTTISYFIDGNYLIKVYGSDSVNCPDSLEFEISVERYVPLNTEVKVFPNPGRGVYMLQIGTNKNDQVELSLFSSLGELVKSFEYQSEESGAQLLEFDISDMANGAYYLEIRLNNESLNRNSFSEGFLKDRRLDYFLHSKIIKY